MAERVYEKRLDAYPKALELTEPLRRRHLLGFRGDVGAYLDGVRIELQRWHSGSAAFIMSQESLDALLRIERLLGGNPSGAGGPVLRIRGRGAVLGEESVPAVTKQ
jgi:hypothetical protein